MSDVFDERTPDQLRAALGESEARLAACLHLEAGYVDQLLEKWDQTAPDIQRAIVTKFAVMLAGARADFDALRQAICRHRDQRGDDRCHLDDAELYAVVGPVSARDLPPRDVFLESCARFWEQRRTGTTVGCMTVKQLETELARVRGLATDYLRRWSARERNHLARCGASDQDLAAFDEGTEAMAAQIAQEPAQATITRQTGPGPGRDG